MKKLLQRLCLAMAGWMAVFGAVAADAPSSAAAGSIPIASFFSNQDIQAAKLSPSGKWIALTTASPSSRVFLAVLNIEGDARRLEVVANFANTDIRSFEWVNDDRLVFNTIDNGLGLNDQRFGPGLFSIKRDGSQMRLLIRRQYGAVMTTGSNIVTHSLGPDHELAAVINDGGNDVVIEQYKFDETSNDILSVTPKRLDVVTGAVRLLGLGAPANVQDWVYDRKGEARAAIAVNQGQEEIFWRQPGQNGWKSVARAPSMRNSFLPVAVDGAGTLYVGDRTKGPMQTFGRFDFATGKPAADPMIRAADFDLRPTSLVFNQKNGALLGVRFETDAGSTAWFDPAMKKAQAMVDERFPGRINVVQCGDCSGDDPLLVNSYTDRDPGTYFFYRPATKSWETIGRSRNEIDPARMATLDIYRTKARDGEDLPVWVTMPIGDSAKPRPAVVLVHGGPWVRGVSWRWNRDAQFLASRGYVVIEPEYRGSLGYGQAHFTRSFGEWGLKMEDDLVDAVRWAADKGMIDPNRVCIAGASYGGYATLMGLVRDPATFKCGVAWVAVTDPRLLFEYDSRTDSQTESREYTLPILLGDPVKDAARLRDSAPVEHAKDIRAPLLMAFGGNDQRVPLVHGTRMVDALRAAGAKPEYVVYEGEGHGWLKVETRVDFWTRVERFLAANLK